MAGPPARDSSTGTDTGTAPGMSAGVNANTAPTGPGNPPPIDRQGLPIPGAGRVPLPATLNYSHSSGPRIAPGQSSAPNPPPSARFSQPPVFRDFSLKGKFGQGFELMTGDEEFVLQFHDLTQIDFRGYQQGGQNPVHDTFEIPRQWWIISGRITKPWEYFLSFQQGIDIESGLDIFLNAHYDDRVQFKMGRYKTPFTYEFYTEPVQGLISPEYSLFTANFALYRSVGAMTWGRLFDKIAPLDYAAGIFNSARNSFIDSSDAKNFLGYLNWRPFASLKDTPLENFVIGGSVMAGTQTSIPIPTTLRTLVGPTGNSTIGVPWLSFNSDARESGGRAFWDLHAAWYYQHLSLIAEWQSGYQDYALTSNLAAHDRIGVDSYYVQAGYFITGETVAGRGLPAPLHDFDLRSGRFGTGAIELTGRFNALDMTKNVFTSGLADPNLWTNNLYMTDIGFNWYLNQNIKLVFDWNHAVFGDPVQYNATSKQKTSDVFLFRFQLYF